MLRGVPLLEVCGEGFLTGGVRRGVPYWRCAERGSLLEVCGEGFLTGGVLRGVLLRFIFVRALKG